MSKNTDTKPTILYAYFSTYYNGWWYIDKEPPGRFIRKLSVQQILAINKQKQSKNNRNSKPPKYQNKPTVVKQADSKKEKSDQNKQNSAIQDSMNKQSLTQQKPSLNQIIAIKGQPSQKSTTISANNYSSAQFYGQMSLEQNKSKVDNCYQNPINNMYQKRSQVHNKPQTQYYFPSTNKKTLRGLQNIGNTCYINSALQCLHKTPLLKQKIQSQCKKNFSPIIQEYLLLCQELQNSSSYYGYNPYKIKQLIALNNQIFTGYNQNDSAQFLNYMINAIHQATNTVKSGGIRPQISKDEHTDDDQLCHKYIKRDELAERSIINDIFYGRYMTEYKCSQCGHSNKLFQRFNIVYLPIPNRQKVKNHPTMHYSNYTYRPLHGQQQRGKISLQDCIKQFKKEQKIEEWPCRNQHCKKVCDFTKTIQIFRTNHILIFCLKRFDQNLQKMQDPIQIPPFCQIKQGSKYELYAIINHIGSVNFGHYYSYCYNQSDGEWYKYNDSSVTQISKPSGEESSSAYVLFYKKCNQK